MQAESGASVVCGQVWRWKEEKGRRNGHDACGLRTGSIFALVLLRPPKLRPGRGLATSFKQSSD